MIYGRERLTHQRDLQLDEGPVGESLRASGENHGRADGGVYEVRASGEFQEVVVQTSKTAEGGNLTTKARRTQSISVNYS
jgi:hypothetical protein